MRYSLPILIVIFSIGQLSAQNPPATPAKDKTPKLPPSPLDKIEGYKRHVIEGFTLMISSETLNADVSKFEVKPLDVLEMELKTVVKIMPTKHVETLRKVLIWVEWDEKQRMSNGRGGSALAVYSGGTQTDLVYEGKQPLKSKAITVLRMVSLTKEHQPDIESGRCVLLHELAHAVHDQYLTMEHTGIIAGYKTAMERKLYTKDQYISTNEAEFFAQATCAYYDQLDHYPKTRDDLKKHDPATHKLLESIWGYAKRPIPPGFAARPKKLFEINGSDKYDLGITMKDIVLGEPLHGPAFKAADANGKVLVLSNFGGDEQLILDKLSKIHADISAYGGTVVVAQSYVAAPATVRRRLEERNVAYSAIETALFPTKDGEKLRSADPGHTLIFDSDGKCVFRGSGYDALPHARAAVARMLLSKHLPPETPKSFTAVVESLTQGTISLWEAIPKMAGVAAASDTENAKLAREISAVIAAPVQAIYTEAAGLAKTDPIAAYALAEKIVKEHKGAPVTAKASTLVEQLKVNPVVFKELQARTMLEPIRKLDAHLMTQQGSFDPGSPRFHRENSAALQQLFEHQALLKKKHPMSRAAEEGAKIAAKYQRD